MTIGENLKRLREERGWTIENLSNKMGCRVALMKDMEENKVIPDALLLTMYELVFGVNGAEITGIALAIPGAKEYEYIHGARFDIEDMDSRLHRETTFFRGIVPCSLYDRSKDYTRI